LLEVSILDSKLMIAFQTEQLNIFAKALYVFRPQISQKNQIPMHYMHPNFKENMKMIALFLTNGMSSRLLNYFVAFIGMQSFCLNSILYNTNLMTFKSECGDNAA